MENDPTEPANRPAFIHNSGNVRRIGMEGNRFYGDGDVLVNAEGGAIGEVDANGNVHDTRPTEQIMSETVSDLRRQILQVRSVRNDPVKSLIEVERLLNLAGSVASLWSVIAMNNLPK